MLWRGLSTLLSIAAGAPGGLMHDSTTLGALLSSPLQGRFGLGPTELGQLAAVGATAAFVAGRGAKARELKRAALTWFRVPISATIGLTDADG